MSMTKRFHNVAVLMGGPSSEREISLRSGAAVVAGLTAAGYAVTPLDIKGRTLELPAGIEAVFIALHGEFGEDGQVQTLLETRRIPYTGSGPEASRVAVDKRLSKAVFVKAGIPTAAYEVLGPQGRRTLALPVIIKPPCQGSTIGIHRVSTEAEWPAAFADALRYDGEVLVEAFIPGRELTCGVVGDEVLPVTEIIAPNDWYDFAAKYQPGQSRHLCPAPLDPATTRRCQQIALQVFKALGCRGLGRVDFRLTPEGELFVLELNNIPGFTNVSLLPEAAQVAGLTFPALCARIMEMATLD